MKTKNSFLRLHMNFSVGILLDCSIHQMSTSVVTRKYSVPQTWHNVANNNFVSMQKLSECRRLSLKQYMLDIAHRVSKYQATVRSKCSWLLCSPKFSGVSWAATLELLAECVQWKLPPWVWSGIHLRRLGRLGPTLESPTFPLLQFSFHNCLFQIT